MFPIKTLAATVCVIALTSPIAAYADPACNAMVSQVKRAIHASNIPGSDHDGAMSDQTAFLKKAQAAKLKCLFGHDEDANAIIAGIYKQIPNSGPPIVVTRNR